jgi:adenosylhomocysteinase
MVADYKVADTSLARSGRVAIEWAERMMPVLLEIRSRFLKERPLEGIRIGACLHVTKETAVLMRTLMAGGADVALAGSNPLSTQDDVAAALVEDGVRVFAWRKETLEEYWWSVDRVISYHPDISMDDGGDLTTRIHENGAGSNVIGGTEETTTGLTRLRSMERKGMLRYPIIAVNDAETKWDFDNVYGTGQSTIDGLVRATNTLLAGKKVVVAGYGHCGRGIANRARGMGARVIVTEVDPIRALKALMDGFEVLPMSEACRAGDIFITATGNIDVIRGEHIAKMKDLVILANSGHFNVEINVNDLEEMSTSKKQIRDCVEEYTLSDGRRIYLLAQGRLVNLVCAEGHPAEVMDMSFSNQALSVEYLIKYAGELKPLIYRVPKDVDMKVAELKLKSIGVTIDKLNERQTEYMKSYTSGT